MIDYGFFYIYISYMFSPSPTNVMVSLSVCCLTTAEVKLVCFSSDHVTNQTETLGVWTENLICIVRVEWLWSSQNRAALSPETMFKPQELYLTRFTATDRASEKHLDKHYMHLHLLVEWCCQTQMEFVEKLYWMLQQTQQIERSASALTLELSFSIEL